MMREEEFFKALHEPSEIFRRTEGCEYGTDAIAIIAAELAAAHAAGIAEGERREREACAKIAETFRGAGMVTEHGFLMGPNTPNAIAAAIRARANTGGEK